MNKHGFTLIELMIVIIILGILSTIGLSLYVSTQKKSRDLSRKAALSAVVKALENYMTDKGEYPLSSSDGKILWRESDGSTSFSWGEAFADPKSSADEKTVYLASLPKDKLTNQTYFYEAIPSDVDGKIKGYRLYAKLENTKDPDITGPFQSVCSSDSTNPNCNYVLTSDVVAPPPVCLANGSGCSLAGGASCCNGSCSPFYAYALFTGYSEGCPQQYFCGSPGSAFRITPGVLLGESCESSKDCCEKPCTTFYAPNCTSEKFCGTTKSGYSTTRAKDDGQACSAGTDCCSGVCNTFYKTGCPSTSGTFCGASPPSGYGISPPSCCLANGGTCSSNANCCSGNCCGTKCMAAGAVLITYYRDHDVDGYPKLTDTKQSCTGAPTEYIAKRSDNKFDCFDSNANVHPGQTHCFTEGYINDQHVLSYDYDCVNGQTTCTPIFYSYSNPSCCDDSRCSSNCYGYSTIKPVGCGVTGYVGTLVTKRYSIHPHCGTSEGTCSTYATDSPTGTQSCH